MEPMKRRGRPPKSVTPVVEQGDTDMQVGKKARDLIRADKDQKKGRDVTEEWFEVNEKGKLRRCYRVSSGTVYRRYQGNIRHPEIRALYETLKKQGKVQVA